MKLEKQNNIDDFFKMKLEDAKYEETNSSWLLVNHLMKEKKRKRKIFRARSFFLGITILAIGIFFFQKNNIIKTQENTSVKEKLLSNNLTSDETNNQEKLKSKSKATTQEQINGSNYINNNKASVTNENTKNNRNHHQITSNKENLLIVKNEVNYAKKDNNNTVDNTDAKYIKSTSSTDYILKGKDKIKVIITSINKELNSNFDEYAPVINADGSEMYFTSRRPVTEKDIKKGKSGTENIFYTKFNQEKISWGKAKLMSKPINDESTFNSAVAISNDGQRLFVYRDDKYGNGDIYEAVLNGTKWSKPEPLPEPINSKYLETTVSLSPDGNTIYFVSNRPGGYGSLDIWSCTKDKNGNWSNAQNLGSEINTETEEEAVFIHPDGKTLYFSSRGHKGNGGYDIYFSRLENGKWTKPVNLENPINTSNDDVYFVVDASGEHAYYASESNNRDNGKDLYKITFIHPNEEKENIAQLTLFKGKVLDKAEKFPLDAKIELIDLGKNELITTLNTNTTTGAFMVSLPAGKNYAINVQRKGYLFYSENFNIPPADEYKEVKTTILLDKLITGAKVVMKNIFYDYDKATLRPESKTELDKLYELMAQNPALKIELSAHTDSRGSDSYNLNLSQNRAQSCVNYLIDKGIDKTQIVAKGYGEQQLVISNEDITKLSDESAIEMSHQQNRRSEIKIIDN